MPGLLFMEIFKKNVKYQKVTGYTEMLYLPYNSTPIIKQGLNFFLCSQKHNTMSLNKD